MVGGGWGALSSCRDKGQKLWTTFRNVNFCCLFEKGNKYVADRMAAKANIVSFFINQY